MTKAHNEILTKIEMKTENIKTKANSKYKLIQ